MVISNTTRRLRVELPGGTGSFDPVFELEAVLHVVRAEQVVDDLHLGDVVGAADVEVLHVVPAEELAGSTFPELEESRSMPPSMARNSLIVTRSGKVRNRFS